MGAFYETIPESLIKWILEQKMFWVATAPLAGSGHVNVSPKGGEYFGIVDNKTFWYMELTGSGSETLAHLYERGNGRITVMFNAFDGPPRIVRLWGKGVLDSFQSRMHHLTLMPRDRSALRERYQRIPGFRCRAQCKNYTGHAVDHHCRCTPGRLILRLLRSILRLQGAPPDPE